MAPAPRSGFVRAIVGATVWAAWPLALLPVDRRFNRSRHDAERTVSTFAGRLRDEIDLEQLTMEIGATVSRTVQPTSVSLWLRE